MENVEKRTGNIETLRKQEWHKRIRLSVRCKLISSLTVATVTQCIQNSSFFGLGTWEIQIFYLHLTSGDINQSEPVRYPQGHGPPMYNDSPPEYGISPIEVVPESERCAWDEDLHTFVAEYVEGMDGCFVNRRAPKEFKGIMVDGELLIPRKKRRPNAADRRFLAAMQALCEIGSTMLGPDWTVSTVEVSWATVGSKGPWHRDVSQTGMAVNVIVALRDVNEEQNAVTYVRTPCGKVHHMACRRGRWCAFDGGLQHCAGPNRSRGPRRMLLATFMHNDVMALPHDNMRVYRAFLSRNRPVRYLSFALFNVDSGFCRGRGAAYTRSFLHHMTRFAQEEPELASAWTVVLHHDYSVSNHALAYLQAILPHFRSILVHEEPSIGASMMWRLRAHDLVDARAYFLCDADTGVTKEDRGHMRALQDGTCWIAYSTASWDRNITGRGGMQLPPTLSVEESVFIGGSFGVDMGAAPPSYADLCMKHEIDSFLATFPDIHRCYGCDEYFMNSRLLPIVSSGGSVLPPAHTSRFNASHACFAEAKQFRPFTVPLFPGMRVKGPIAAFLNESGHDDWEVTEGRLAKRHRSAENCGALALRNGKKRAQPALGASAASFSTRTTYSRR